MRRFFYSIIAIAIFICSASAAELPINNIKLPSGFEISVFADSLSNARSLAVGKNGTVFVGSQSGKVFALVTKSGESRALKTIALLRGLDSPNGVAFRDGALYVAEVNRILRYDDIEARLDNPPAPVVIYDKLPKDKHHGQKFIRFGPDGMLYVAVGAPCNICEPDARYANLGRMKPDGSSYEIFARGIRNTVGFDWHPETRELYFTENGRDQLGDDAPPDELNHAPKSGMHFGYPYCHGKNISDPNYGNQHACSEFTPPAFEFEAHVAALGMRFYTGTMFPTEYRNTIIVAQHGSWNRSKKSGYRLMRVSLQPNQTAKYEVFAEGWKQGESVWGRPVDVQVMPDGALLVSDDMAGAVYRISYKAAR